MKKRNILFVLLTSSLLFSCTVGDTNNSSDSSKSNNSGSTNTNNNNGSTNNNDNTNTYNPDDTQTPVVSTSIQDANILHAWNWKLDDITSKLNLIKNAGYEAIQISPMQPAKEQYYGTSGNTANNWWRLYQPLDLSITTSKGYLGDRTDLIELCTAAKAKGIKIVVDVVCNHMASENNGANYSYGVYHQYPTHNYNGQSDDDNQESIVRGKIGLIDLDTGHQDVKDAVKAMLIDYINCGVSGFRFDAAKHIETPDDGAYASNFWPYVLDATTEHALSLGKEKPYYYGEVLNTPGKNRSWSYYTKLMSICDSKQGESLVLAVKNGNGGSVKTTYNTGVNPDHLVLWAESHDTYANTSDNAPYDITRDYSTDIINRTYMIQASRKDAATLYLARVHDIYSNTLTSSYDDTGWQNPEIKAINDFHTHYVKQSESPRMQDGKYFVNVRGSGSFAGAAIINVCGNNSATINVNGLANGEYTDLVSGNIFTVNNGQVLATFTNGACILVPKGAIEPAANEPEISESHNVVFTNPTQGKYYYAWVFGGSQSDKWVKLTTVNNEFGFNIGSYTQFTVAEFNSDYANWGSQNWQTKDITYTGSKMTFDCQTVQRK